MFLALDNARMEGSGLCRGTNCISVVYLPDPTEDGATSSMLAVADDHPSKAQVHTAVSSRSSTATSSNSSIGRNSDSGVGSDSSDPDDSGEPEVQSSYRGPLDTMDSLGDSLPMRRGISKFYAGKSKSFTSLSEAAAAVAKDLAKPDNPYNRKRKNLILRSNIRERNRHLGDTSTGSKSGVAKKPVNFSRSSLALDAMSKLESSCADGGEDNEQQPLPPFPPNGRLWPLSNHGNKGSTESPPQMPFASRSFSLFDLQGAASSASRGEKRDKVFS
ncbi:protein OXIDATIVE STRESS 3 LIKE 1-like [Nymphaea colorata]|nr:protein OXIDATIVE STRESS 3 LIKE 1-like [Nymphaea colorata]